MGDNVDVYFSADIETDGPIPGPFSMLSFGLVYAGRFDGKRFERPDNYSSSIYRELAPISDQFEDDALKINGLNRDELVVTGISPERAMLDAYQWVHQIADGGNPVFVAYPLSFDWSWMYWYFVRFCSLGTPFGHSSCFDIKTAIALKLGRPVSVSGKSNLPKRLRAVHAHTHNALDDAIEQAEIFANIFEWGRQS
ncbi:3'-5' exoribonuclease domain-containing protein [Asticcacaulis sp. 201]|uniref:3'-5' exoribonuclease domain-containing protein n=1 Tax=Asticcacaulis sp. 201 TaxID=3028787 RepID=UPI0029169B6F|nr:3'-5' exoribonuclease [Asticcacaulis sp. 201]MDV6329853.1 exonuclease domain-containing protein [Asticcacaulis sp. 201]